MVPSDCYDLYCAQVMTGLYTGLFDFETNDQGQMVAINTPLAKSVTTSDKGATWTIEMNPGFLFTNGEAVTAQTFVDTWNFTANGGNGQQLGFVFGPSQLNVEGYDDVSGPKSTDAKMSGIKAVNDTTIEMKLAAPIGQTLFTNFVAGPQIFPMPSEAFKDIEAYEKQPIGNGPYKLTGPWTNQGGALAKNPDYLGPAGNADQIEFKIYADDNAKWADLQANTLDISADLPENALATAPQVLGDRYINTPGGLQYTYYGFPAADETFKEKNVRIAIAKSINVEDINQKLYFGTRQVATSYAPATIPGGGTDLCGDNCVFDATKAKSLLTEAGGLPGGTVYFTQLANETGDVQKAICNQIQANLGVKCEVTVFSGFGKMLSAIQSKSVEPGTIVGSGWVADNPTIQNMIAATFTTDNPSNAVAYSNEKFDSLLQEGSAAQDEPTQIAKWQEAEKVLFEDFPAWPFQWRNQVGGYSTNVSNVAISPGGFINLATVKVNS